MRIAGLVSLVLVLLAAGAVLWFGDMETDFGWFAYAPLDQQSAPGILLVTGRRQVALLLSLIGLVLLSGLVGFVVGRRSKPDSSV
jgi:heme/copper-type cytochrome/quinol oxidase subunit 1